MAKKIKCIKLGIEAEGLDFVPIPGELGQKILENVSEQAWQGWLEHQTMLINEYRLSLAEAKAREFLMQELEKYFFGEGSTQPEGFQSE